ncbi:uncharacterized protein LOC107035689 [Diachasma alloeum]|uniref:uncharacterized protein LOC107035689 n=1 Tax=Diachasma alloeum TaxID=454923 RepID=UPI0007382B1D|nr:uncharacterized protein LOC107035689 [Diachasma alloeum]
MLTANVGAMLAVNVGAILAADAGPMLAANIFQIELEASPQITKFAPVEDWIAFKRRTSDIKPLDKFLGKLRATYDFVFHKPENVSNVGKILSSDKPKETDTKPYKFILSNSHVTDDSASEKEEVTESPVYVELLGDEVMSTKESSISRVATDWADEVETVEPLSELELLNDNDDDIDRPGDTVNPQTSFELSAAVARAFLRWLSSIIGFTHGAYLKITNSTGAP